MPTRLIIFASAALHREAWRALLSAQPGILVSATAGDPSALAALPRYRPPTAILADWPEPSLDMARRLKAASPGSGLLFLVHTYDLLEILPLLQAGAQGCISRDASLGDLARGIIAAGRGEIVLPPAVAARALSSLAQGEIPGNGLVETLSGREIEVLHLLAQGFTNKDIAQTLILSVRTVEAHLRSIFSKLGVRSRTEAALWAVKRGYGTVSGR